MRKSHLLIFAALVLCASCTKTEKTYYPDGHVQSSIQYRFGKEHGKSIYYYDTPNTVEIEMEMKRGKRHGEFNRYYENGYLDTHCQYVNDSIEGVETNYTANGVKAQEFTYVHGIKNGPHKAYHLFGEIKVEGNYKNGKYDGEWTYYDDRGVVVGEGAFKEGTGEVVFYDGRGLPMQVTRYVDGKKDGKEEYFTPAGEVYKEIVYKNERIVSEKVDSTLLR
ncbi:MAG: toxin-antitoxin system YwqK family antitoxin [Bacteroidales bacterium]|nr:toxin-antitoxin system YwqK family antitoxin [Bacteroidales bacterium]